MDQVNSLINKLADAAAHGADRLSLLAMVEEIRFQLMQAGKPVVEAKASVSVWMPHATAPTERVSQPAAEPIAAAPLPKPQVATTLAAPRPPAVVLVEEEPEVEVPIMQNPAPEVKEELHPVAELPLAETYRPEVLTLVPEPEPEPIVAPEPLAVRETVSITADKNEEITAPVYEWKPEPLLEKEAPAPDVVHEAPHHEPAHFELALSEEMLKEIDAIIKGEMPKKPEAPKEEAKELNEKIAQRTKVLNEVFDRKEPELAEVLAQPKINDLRKAISVAEKYQYINSLFRGDEDMFERSIRTINNFGILPEADYWVQRELIIKLGWNDEDELVQKFYSLVKRRFS